MREVIFCQIENSILSNRSEKRSSWVKLEALLRGTSYPDNDLGRGERAGEKEVCEKGGGGEREEEGVGKGGVRPSAEYGNAWISFVLLEFRVVTECHFLRNPSCLR